MNALAPMRGQITGTRLRVAFATTLTGLLLAVLLYPMFSDAYWRDDRRLAADPNIARLVQAIMEADAPEVRRLLGGPTLDLNALDKCGVTPLSHAIAVHGHPGGEPLVSLLIERGADVNRPDGYGHTPLMWCVSQRDVSLTERLLREGADVNARRPDGTSVLHVAVHSDAGSDIVRLLLAAGADTMARDGEGKTPADYARAAECAELAQLLDAPRSQDHGNSLVSQAGAQ